ncbi:hypothetical protein J6590_086809 [Homalodisca vitripennis]|nr:hypothetical protein J6590_086809 [Homalodisca vitripennis]
MFIPPSCKILSVKVPNWAQLIRRKSACRVILGQSIWVQCAQRPALYRNRPVDSALFIPRLM